jgi:hypothetical protein
MTSIFRKRLGIGILAASLLGGCAASVPKGAEMVAPGWSGRLDSTARLGVYLAAAPGEYSQAGFETMSRAEETMKTLDARIKWTWIDSSLAETEALNGWDLDSLALAIRRDTALAGRTGGGMVRVNAALAPSTRSALRRVGLAYRQDFLIAIRPGGNRAQKDSTKIFQDQAWFGIFDLKTGQLMYSLQAPTEGKQSQAASAESDWARGIWEEFRTAIQSLPRRIGK